MLRMIIDSIQSFKHDIPGKDIPPNRFINLSVNDLDIRQLLEGEELSVIKQLDNGANLFITLKYESERTD